MKLFMNKNEKYEEPEVHMFFHKQTKEVEQVEKFVRSLSITIPAKYEDEIYKLYPTDVFVWDAPSHALSRPFTNNYSLSGMAEWLYLH